MARNTTFISYLGTSWRLTAAGYLYRGDDKQGKVTNLAAATALLSDGGRGMISLTDGTRRFIAGA